MLLTRIITVVIGAPFLIGAILCPWVTLFRLVVVFCVLLASREFFKIVGHTRKETAFGLVLTLLHLLYLFFFPEAASFLIVETAILVIAVFGFYLFSPLRIDTLAVRISLTLLGLFYIGTLGSFVGLLRDMPDGVFWVFVLLGMTWLNDTSAYFFGHRFGKRRLAPVLSPGKTVEGFLGGFLGTLAGFLLFWFIFGQPIALAKGLLLIFLVGIFGPLGDLSESLIKRSFGVKDSGNIIPGHGGMLDRIDALLFTAPVVYFFARAVS